MLQNGLLIRVVVDLEARVPLDLLVHKVIVYKVLLDLLVLLEQRVLMEQLVQVYQLVVRRVGS